MAEDTLRITRSVAIPSRELSYRASRSSGPGGQHANTSSTRIELVWDLEASEALSDTQRNRLRNKLGSRLTNTGVLILASEATRSQHRNKEDVTERFVEVLREALKVPKPRKKTRPSRAAKERRLQSKKKRSQTKKLRGPVSLD